MLLDYMRKGYRTEYITESYVSVPPALFIIDEYGNTFTLGFNVLRYSDGPNGEYAFNILMNGFDTGIYGSRIEKRNNRVRVFTRTGWKYWNGKNFT